MTWRCVWGPATSGGPSSAPRRWEDAARCGALAVDEGPDRLPHDLGHGAAYSFLDPDGHRFELFYESQRYEAAGSGGGTISPPLPLNPLAFGVYG